MSAVRSRITWIVLFLVVVPFRMMIFEIGILKWSPRISKRCSGGWPGLVLGSQASGVQEYSASRLGVTKLLRCVESSLSYALYSHTRGPFSRDILYSISCSTSRHRARGRPVSILDNCRGRLVDLQPPGSGSWNIGHHYSDTNRLS